MSNYIAHSSERNKEIAKRTLGDETLQAIAKEYGITRERVRQIGYALTGITKHSLSTERTKRRKENEMFVAFATAMSIALSNELRCRVCGAYNIRAGLAAYLHEGSDYYLCCSCGCTKIYEVLRYRIERDMYNLYQATSILNRREKFSNSMISHAQRIKAGTADKLEDRYYVWDDSKAAKAILEVRHLRTVLGTESYFDDDIMTVEIRDSQTRNSLHESSNAVPS